MQTIFESKDEGEYSRRTGTVDLVVCVGRIGRCVERKCNGGNGSREGGI